jgi:hypothetical protein
MDAYGMSEEKTPLTLRIEWSPDHPNNKIVQFSPANEEDDGYGPSGYELFLAPDIEEWCWTNPCESPDLIATDWVESDGQKFPSTIELTFDDENEAILFRVKWLDGLKSD